jgi:hypothetical protein
MGEDARARGGEGEPGMPGPLSGEGKRGAEEPKGGREGPEEGGDEMVAKRRRI